MRITLSTFVLTVALFAALLTFASGEGQDAQKRFKIGKLLKTLAMPHTALPIPGRGGSGLGRLGMFLPGVAIGAGAAAFIASRKNRHHQPQVSLPQPQPQHEGKKGLWARIKAFFKKNKSVVPPVVPAVAPAVVPAKPLPVAAPVAKPVATPAKVPHVSEAMRQYLIKQQLERKNGRPTSRRESKILKRLEKLAKKEEKLRDAGNLSAKKEQKIAALMAKLVNKQRKSKAKAEAKAAKKAATTASTSAIKAAVQNGLTPKVASRRATFIAKLKAWLQKRRERKNADKVAQAKEGLKEKHQRLIKRLRKWLKKLKAQKAAKKASKESAIKRRNRQRFIRRLLKKLRQHRKALKALKQQQKMSRNRDVKMNKMNKKNKSSIWKKIKSWFLKIRNGRKNRLSPKERYGQRCQPDRKGFKSGLCVFSHTKGCSGSMSRQASKQCGAMQVCCAKRAAVKPSSPKMSKKASTEPKHKQFRSGSRCMPKNAEHYQSGFCVPMSLSHVSCNGKYRRVSSGDCDLAHICCAERKVNSDSNTRKYHSSIDRRRHPKLAKLTGPVCEPRNAKHFTQGRCVQASEASKLCSVGGRRIVPSGSCPTSHLCCARKLFNRGAVNPHDPTLPTGPRKSNKVDNGTGIAHRRLRRQRQINMKKPKNTIAVAKVTCRPSNKKFADGNCLKKDQEKECMNIRGAAIVNADGCGHGESCCAPLAKTKRTRFTHKAIERLTGGLCEPESPHYGLGKCVLQAKATKQCHANKQQLVVAGKGCSEGHVCCAGMIKNRSPKGISTVCHPRDTDYFMPVGSCLPNKQRASCSGTLSETTGSGCSAGTFCCAQKKPKAGTCTSSLGFTNGQCVSESAAAQCHGNKAVQRGGIGCSKGQVCCAEKKAEKCTEGSDSRMGNPVYTSEFAIPAPYVDWRKTEVLRDHFSVTGVKLFFKGQLTVTIKSDVTCIQCGKNTKYSGVGVTVTKTVWITKRIVGVSVPSNFAGSSIPGLNIGILSLELKEAYDTIVAVRSEIDSVMRSVRGIRGVFMCEKDGVDKEAASRNLIKAIDSQKRGLLESSESLSESEISDALNAAMSSDVEEERIVALPDLYLELKEDAPIDLDAILAENNKATESKN